MRRDHAHLHLQAPKRYATSGFRLVHALMAMPVLLLIPMQRAKGRAKTKARRRERAKTRENISDERIRAGRKSL